MVEMKGVKGVLGNLVSVGPVSPASVEADKPPKDHPSERPSREVEPSSAVPDAGPRTHVARKGRPPGPREGESVAKEKVTLRIDKALMDAYRDWSWEERCQLGELVERALVKYRDRPSRQRPD